MCIKINIVFISDVYYNKHFVIYDVIIINIVFISYAYYNKHCVYI